MTEEMEGLGYNSKLVKQKNRLTALKIISTQREISRAELASRLNLTKAASGKIVADLIQEGLISQQEASESAGSGSMGRKPIWLKLSDTSPCIFGILIKRGVFYSILADLSGRIIDREEYQFGEGVTADTLLEVMKEKYDKIRSGNGRSIVAVGISSVGPIDGEGGRILNPPNFYGMKDIPICSRMEEHTGVPCYLINDSNGGALAEKLYGQGRDIRDFIYVHIMNGIGSGCVLDDRIYTGVTGQCGEIGHTSINTWGPRCACGNCGCLELYANSSRMNARMRSMRHISRGEAHLSEKEGDYEFGEILEAAEKGSAGAIAAVDEFAEYLSAALTNMINILSIDTVIIGYDDNENNSILEAALESRINERALIAPNRRVTVGKSVFQGEAPLYGSIALITNKIFSGEITF